MRGESLINRVTFALTLWELLIKTTQPWSWERREGSATLRTANRLASLTPLQAGAAIVEVDTEFTVE